eukprot:3178754-Alexandrium_andersonii.AAC.1
MSDEDLARLMAGLEILGPSFDEAAGMTGPPPSVASSREPAARVAREPAGRSDDGEATSLLELSFIREEQRARDVTEIVVHNNAYQVAVAVASLARFNEDREDGDNAEHELQNPA